jgi:hypothetical protein
MAALLLMVDLKVRHSSASLASPAIPLQDFSTKSLVRFRIWPQAGAGAASRELARDAAAFPPGDVVDTIVKVGTFRNKQIHRALWLLHHLSTLAEERTPDVSRKPSQREEGERLKEDSNVG